MSSDIEFDGAFKRFLKGDADPLNLFGLNPNPEERAANAADRGRRASQIEAEQGSDALTKAGGSTDAPTKQVAKLKSKTAFKALSPLNPLPLPGVTATGVAIEAAKNKKDAGSEKKKLAASNTKHAATAQTVNRAHLSNSRFRQSILGGGRSV